MRDCLAAFVISASIFATGASGQTSTSSSTGPSGFSGNATFTAPPAFSVRPVTNAPYSGEEVTEQIQTLADGTHITQKSADRKVYRDSLGRTRTERQMFGGMAMAGRLPESPVVIEITDPVAHVKYTLDTVNKVAHRQQLPAAPNLPAGMAMRSGVLGGALPAPGVAGAPSAPGMAGGIGISGGGGVRTATAAPTDMPRPQMSSEKLGTQTIEGVLAEGIRQASTWEVGSQGNDRPISVVNETWMSPALKVMILNKSTDPRSGEHTQKLTNISQAEPPADFFQPPADYTLVDETGTFTIHWGATR